MHTPLKLKTTTNTDEAHAASSSLTLTKHTERALAWLDEEGMAACGVTTGAVGLGLWWWCFGRLWGDGCVVGVSLSV